MNYKMLALDLDGTLLDEDNAINEQTQRSVEIVREKGLKVIIATGRMFCSALPYHRQLGLEGPLIAYNGAYVKHVENDELIFHRPVELEMARQIIRECEENNLHVNLYQDDNLYMEQADSEGRAYERTSGVKAHYLNSSLSG
ncbi:MAG: HAD family hydrolase, partial [Bacillota bacterium]